MRLYLCKMARRRSYRTVCDSLLCTAAVAAPVALSLAYYRHDLRQLLRMFFLVAVLIGALLVVRHWLGRARRRVSGWFDGGRREREGDSSPEERRPDLDRGRDEALARAQRTHDQKAEDYHERVGGPRRERRLQEAERRSQYLRGFGEDEGRVVGATPQSTSQSRLLREGGSHGNDRGGGATADQRAGSCDDHVTQDVIDEGDKSGRKVWLAVQLPGETTIRSQFHISQTVQVVYQWLKREGHDTRGHVLVTPHPRYLLDDRGRTLQQYGITMDTKLILEELVD